jgi:hypothetical protein
LICAAFLLLKSLSMDATLQADLQAVSDKDSVAFSVTTTVVPVPVTEIVEFVPTPPVV